MTIPDFRNIALVVAALLTPFPGNTQELPKDSWPLSTRVFFLGPNSDGARIAPDFIPLDRAPVVQAVIEADPLFERAVVHIQALNHPVSGLWEHVDDADTVRNAPTFPEMTRAAGYDTYARRPNDITTFKLFTNVGPRDHQLSCSLDRYRLKVNFCSLVVSYPPDPNIFLNIRLYSPTEFSKTPGRFRAMADRIRAIVTCLDVTDELKSGQPEFNSLTVLDPTVCTMPALSS